jgi:hypothetical protein
MRKTLAAFLLAGSLLGAQEPKGWKPLWNGKDLAGWETVGKTEGKWIVEQETLVCTGGGSGWLSTKEEYGDFELELEFNVSVGGNSGVFIRAPREGRTSEVGMEIQILDDDAPIHKDIKPYQHTASIYGVVAPSKAAQKKAGEWNSMAIRCKGNQVTVTLNGEKVVDADMSAYEKLVRRPRKGYIGLQNHGTRCEFRGLRLREPG